MVLLTAPFDRARAATRPVPWGAGLQIAVAALAVVLAGLALETRGGASGSIGRTLAGAAVHAGFLGLGWVLIAGGRSGWSGPVLRLAALVVAASLLSRLGAWGALAYLAVPVAVCAEARGRAEFAAAGLAWPTLRAAALGLAGGAFLGIHLLITSSLTFGYLLRIDAAEAYWAAAAYDVGISALTAEWLFRGALFSTTWRRWAFAPAVGFSTGLAVLRYVLDPILPAAPEVWLGAALYTGLLGVTACALRAWSQSLLPGYLATVVFFLAYRALGH
jgi:hypothetical protein